MKLFSKSYERWIWADGSSGGGEIYRGCQLAQRSVGFWKENKNIIIISPQKEYHFSLFFYFCVVHKLFFQLLHVCAIKHKNHLHNVESLLWFTLITFKESFYLFVSTLLCCYCCLYAGWYFVQFDHGTFLLTQKCNK